MTDWHNINGSYYDGTRKADPEIARRLKNNLQAGNSSKILDIACGTGNYTMALHQSELEMTGVDGSRKMIARAKEKNKNIRWDTADITSLPYREGTFEGVTCILAIHHFENLYDAFKEIYRVMNRGRLVIFTSSPEQMDNYWLREYFPKAMKKSSEKMPDITRVSEVLKHVGFRNVEQETFLVQPDLQDLFLYSGKYKPSLYLDKKIRSNISTFGNSATKEEMEEGCRRLENDIRTDKISSVRQKFSSKAGDYVFVLAEKV